MYERFYNLRERPFALSPDPEYLYLSRVHREALDYIRYGIESRAGFIVVTGEIGAGKTTLLQTLLQKLDDRTVVARLVNTTLEPRELLEAILIDFGLETDGKSKPGLLRDLAQFLVRRRAEGRRPLLVVDEAQNLSTLALEEIRLLSNLETEKSKLLQILLAGQPDLRDKLASRELEQLRQRVAVSYHIMPLDAEDTEAYINYRLQHASLGRPLRFPAEAAQLIHSLSRGIPRMINVICDAALVFGYAEERHHINRELIEEVVRELAATGVLPGVDSMVTDADRVVAESAPAPAMNASRPSRPEPARPAPVVETAALTDVMQPTAAAPPPEADIMRPAAVSVSEPPAAATDLMRPVPNEDTAADTDHVSRPAASREPSPAVVETVPADNFARPHPVPDLVHPAAAETRPATDVVPSVAPSPLRDLRRPSAAARSAHDSHADALARREHELAARERALAERERQIAEQRRIMAEEYRLLRQRHGETAVPMGATATAGRAALSTEPTVPVPSRAPARAVVPPRSPMRRGAQRRDRAGFWQRLFRLFAGEPAL